MLISLRNGSSLQDEVKTRSLSRSKVLSNVPVQDVRDALGQYVMYRAYLTKIEPDRKLYMAIGVSH